jgi:predicted HicB family RNase H-like nuclease
MIVTGTLTVRHKGYTVEFERDDSHWCGRILYIKDLITVIADRVGDMEQEAKAAIDDYIDTCLELGVEPNEPREGVE